MTVLDAGSGDGWFAGRLLAEMPVGTHITRSDASYTPGDVARLAAASGDGIRFSAVRPSGRFGLLLLLDVLEHGKAIRSSSPGWSLAASRKGRLL